MAVSFLLFTENDWRCYSSAVNPEIEYLIKRFLNAHARVPSPFNGETIAAEPIIIFEHTTQANPTISFKGGMFLNGAVMRVLNHDTLEEDILLFVEDSTAKLWGYSDQYRILNKSSQAKSSEKIEEGNN